MIAVRTLLGFFESVITPALIMITSAWYQRNEAAPRFGLWYCGMGVGQIVGGLISYGAQWSHSSFQGWRIMFLIIGVVNCIVATIILLWLPGTPEEASFLNSAEKEAIAQRLHDDHAGVGVKKLRVRSILETFLDLQTWLLCLLTILNVIPSGVITTYSSILIKGFGYTNKQAALLNMPSGIVTIIALLSSTYAVRKGYQRWFAIILMIIPTLIGACLMSFLPKNNKAGLLAGIYLVNFVSLYAIEVKCSGSYRDFRRSHRMPLSSQQLEQTLEVILERFVEIST
jgi:MFS family permease